MKTPQKSKIVTGSQVTLKVDGKPVKYANIANYTYSLHYTLEHPLPEFFDMLARTGNRAAHRILHGDTVSGSGLQPAGPKCLAVVPKKGPRGCK